LPWCLATFRLRNHLACNANGSTTTFSYDGNGNLLTTSNSAGAGSNRTNTWTSFNLPNTLQQGSGSSVGFKYDADHQRVEEIIASGTTVRTLHKLHPDNQGGLGFEREVVTVNGARTVNENRHYLSVGGQVIGVIKTKTPLVNDLFIGAMNGTLSTTRADANLVNYWHKDSLGSIITVTNRDGAVIERMAFDAWGARETSNGAAAANVNPAHGDRGYTGHEHLDEIGLVHMNGRVYDPVLARFMSPDPVVGDPSDMQHYNRYAYVANSPLRYTDPSGNCPVCYFIAFVVGYEMTQQGDQYWRMVGSFAMMWATQGLVDAGLGVTAGVPGDAINRAAGIANTFNTGGIGNSVLAAAIPTLATGGSVEQAATAGIFAGAFTGVGAAFAGDSVKLVSAHMLLGCAQGAASGGSCGPSAMAAGFGKAATIGLDARDFGVIGNGVTTAIVGGTASALGGGKFANGAKQAGFAYLFNQAVSRGARAAAASCLLGCPGGMAMQSTGDPEIDRERGALGTSATSAGASSQAKQVWYHYTDRAGYEGILKDQLIRGPIVWVTDVSLNAQETWNSLFIGASNRTSYGDYVVKFAADPGMLFLPAKPPLEWIHMGSIRFKQIDVLYVGPNKN
jgi:RHS repeat-associated protein